MSAVGKVLAGVIRHLARRHRRQAKRAKRLLRPTKAEQRKAAA